MRQVFGVKEKNLLDELSSLIKEYTDFGLEIWQLRLNEYTNETIDLPSNLLFRQILEMSDAIAELVQVGCVNASKPLLRGAIEYYFQLIFILKDQTDKASLFFLYHYNKSKLSYLERILYDERLNSLNDKLKNDKVMPNIVLTESEKKAALKDYEALSQTIASNIYSDIRKEYGVKSIKKWFQVLIGSSKIEDLANRVEESALYQILYRDLSSFIHGEDILHTNWVSISSETIGLKALRDISEIKGIVDDIIIVIERAILFFIQYRIDSNKNYLIKLKPLMDRASQIRNKEIIFKY